MMSRVQMMSEVCALVWTFLLFSRIKRPILMPEHELPILGGTQSEGGLLTSSITSEVQSLLSLIEALASLGKELETKCAGESGQTFEDFRFEIECLNETKEIWVRQLKSFPGLASDPALHKTLGNALEELSAENVRRSNDGSTHYCCSGCWRSLCCKRRFPLEVTKSIQRVLHACDNILRLSAGEKTRRSSSSALPLPFHQEKHYVHLKATEGRVYEALTSENGPRLIILHGGAGRGKSWLAKHIALHFQCQILYQDLPPMFSDSDDSGAISVRRQSNVLFSDGVFYVECGQDADIVKIHLELLAQIRSPVRQSEEVQEVSLHEKLEAHLMNKSALIVLDDVWNRNILERLVIPGSKIKYLVTSRMPDLYMDCALSSIEMEKIGQDDGRNFLGKHAGLGDDEMPPHLQETANRMINETEGLPLALANLATVIERKRVTDLDEWSDTLNELTTLLAIEDMVTAPTPSAFIARYPRGLASSMMLAVKSLDTDTQKLLLLAAIFQARQYPPEVVIRTLFQGASGTSFSRRRNILKDRGLIQIEKKRFFLSGLQSGRSYEQTIWSMHGLRKEVILARKTVINTIALSLIGSDNDSLPMETDLDADLTNSQILLIILCALYAENWLADKAAKKLQVPLTTWDLWRRSSSLDLIFCMLQRGNEANRLATQVIVTYVCQGRLEDEPLSKLLAQPDYALSTFKSLECMAYDSLTRLDRPLLTAGTKKTLSHLVNFLEIRVPQTPRSKPNAAASAAALAAFSFKSRELILADTRVLGRLLELLGKNDMDSSELRDVTRALVNLTHSDFFPDDVHTEDLDVSQPSTSAISYQIETSHHSSAFSRGFESLRRPTMESMQR